MHSFFSSESALMPMGKVLATCASMLSIVTTGYSQEKKDNTLLSRMEPGSVIKDLLIPTYDENKKPTSIVRAERLIIETESLVKAEKISLQFISIQSNKNLAPSYFMIDECNYDLTTSLLQSQSKVHAVAPSFTFRSHGMISKITKEQKDITAFFLPPVFGYINPQSSQKIAMNKIAPTLFLIGTALAGEPASPTEAELAASENKPIPSAETANKSVEEAFFSLSPRSKEADDKLSEFAQQHALTIKPIPNPSAPAIDITKPVSPVEAIPQFKPAADAMGFTCNGGIFYDSTTSTLTLLNSITVRDPSYGMTVRGQVQLFFDPEVKSEKKEDDSKNKDVKVEKEKKSFGKIAQMLGTGGVAFESIDEKGIKRFATGDSVLYKVATDEILIKGKRLIFQEGITSRFESKNEDAWLRYNKKTKSFQMSEGWNAQIIIPEQK
jgi:lipopolysaccharide export system protein LptA